MEKANLLNARLGRANLTSARLEQSNLNGAKFQRANLVFARLETASLRDTNLTGANLRGAHMERVVLHDAHLGGTIFFGTFMKDARLLLVRMDRTTSFNMADLRRAALKPYRPELITLDSDQANSMFGDGSVWLPDTVSFPDHWPKANLDLVSFDNEWRMYKVDPITYLPPQDRTDNGAD